MKNSKKIISLALLLAWLFLISSCNKQELSVNVAVSGDYFPSNASKKIYLRESFGRSRTEPFMTDTIKVIYNGDTTVGKKSYKKMECYLKLEANGKTIEQHYMCVLFRKEGSKYYRYYRPYSFTDTSEYIFLDTDKAVGSSWSTYGGFKDEIKTTYTIESINENRVVNGIEYHNVIEVSEDTYYKNISYSTSQYYLSASGQHFFAKDVGEIYTSAESYTYRGIFRKSLLAYLK